MHAYRSIFKSPRALPLTTNHESLQLNVQLLESLALRTVGRSSVVRSEPDLFRFSAREISVQFSRMLTARTISCLLVGLYHLLSGKDGRPLVASA